MDTRNKGNWLPEGVHPHVHQDLVRSTTPWGEGAGACTTCSSWEGGTAYPLGGLEMAGRRGEMGRVGTEMLKASCNAWVSASGAVEKLPGRPDGHKEFLGSNHREVV